MMAVIDAAGPRRITRSMAISGTLAVLLLIRQLHAAGARPLQGL
jgi:hypothetical protein